MRYEGHEQALSVWVALLQAHAAVVERVGSAVERAGITLSAFEVLVRLSFAPDGRLRMQELTDAALLSKSGVTRLTDRLEVAGLLARRSCPADRRGTFAEITPRGRRLVERLSRPFLEAVDQALLTPLPSGKHQNLERMLQAIAEANGVTPWRPPVGTGVAGGGRG